MMQAAASGARDGTNRSEAITKRGCANVLHALATIVAYGLIFFYGFPLFVLLCFPDAESGYYSTAALGGMAAIGLSSAVKSRGVAAVVALVGSCSLILSWATIARVVDFRDQGIFIGTSFPFFVIMLWFNFRFLTDIKRSDASNWQLSIRDIGILLLVVLAFVMSWILVTRFSH